MVQQTQPTALDELKGKMQAAIADGNDADVVKIGKEIVKLKADVEKAEATKIQKEAEAMAGDREKLAKEIWTVMVADGKLGGQLSKVKATGFTFKLDTPEVQYKSVALTVPTAKVPRGGGGGSTGALKEQTGLARHELIDKYASPDEKVGIQKAYDEATSRKDSARYSSEKPVIKRILADNPNLIKK